MSENSGGSRPFVDFNEVKRRVPLPDVLDVLGIRGRFRERNGVLTGVCPFPDHAHGPQPNPDQFKMNVVDGVWLWRCWGDCQATGNVIQFVMRIEGLSAAHVRFWFAEHFGDRLTLRQSKRSGGKAKADPPKLEPEPPETKEARGEAPTPPQAEAKSDSPTLPAAAGDLKPLGFRLQLDQENVPYLRQRGLTDETIRRYGLGMCRRGLMKGYVAIPVYRWPQESADGKENEYPVAYLGRWPGDDHDDSAGRPRYKWPEGFPKSRVVYGLREAVESSSPTDPLIVVEGAFGVYHLAQNGFPNTVAIFGSSMSEEQANLLIATRRPLVLLFDGDEAGRNGMQAAGELLCRRSFARIVGCPDGMQADGLDTAALDQLLR